MKDLAVLLKASNAGHLLSANLHICIVLSAYRRSHTNHQGWVLKIYLAFVRVRFVFLSFTEQCKTQIWNMCVQDKRTKRHTHTYL